MTTLIPKFDLKNGGATPANAVNRPINEKLLEWISVEDFGAIGDGVTDDTTAIQAAIDSLKPTGGTVVFLNKTYKLSSLLLNSTDYKNITLVGQGLDSTVLDFTATGTAITLGVNPGYIENFNMRDMSITAPNTNIVVSIINGSLCSFTRVAVTESGNTSTNSKGFNLFACMGTLFQEVRYAGSVNAKYGFYVDNDSDETEFNHCYIKGEATNATYSIVLDGNAAHTNTVISNCVIGGANTAAIVAGLNAAAQCIQIRNNYFEGAVVGIQLGNAAGPYLATEVEITGNYFYQCTSISVSLRTSKNVNVSYNNFYNTLGANDVDFNTDVTKNTNITVQYNKLTRELGLDATQNKIRYEDFYGNIHDRLSCLTVVSGDTWNPGTIANGASASKDTTITGASLGDFTVASFNTSLGGCSISSYVKAADTVTVVVTNNTGSPITFSSGIVYARVYAR
jgi:hypothetical protein